MVEAIDLSKSLDWLTATQFYSDVAKELDAPILAQIVSHLAESGHQITTMHISVLKEIVRLLNGNLVLMERLSVFLQGEIEVMARRNGVKVVFLYESSNPDVPRELWRSSTSQQDGAEIGTARTHNDVTDEPESRTFVKQESTDDEDDNDAGVRIKAQEVETDDDDDSHVASESTSVTPEQIISQETLDSGRPAPPEKSSGGRAQVQQKSTDDAHHDSFHVEEVKSERFVGGKGFDPESSDCSEENVVVSQKSADNAEGAHSSNVATGMLSIDDKHSADQAQPSRKTLLRGIQTTSTKDDGSFSMHEVDTDDDSLFDSTASQKSAAAAPPAKAAIAPPKQIAARKKAPPRQVRKKAAAKKAPAREQANKKATNKRTVPAAAAVVDDMFSDSEEEELAESEEESIDPPDGEMQQMVFNAISSRTEPGALGGAIVKPAKIYLMTRNSNVSQTSFTNVLSLDERKKLHSKGTILVALSTVSPNIFQNLEEQVNSEAFAIGVVIGGHSHYNNGQKQRRGGVSYNTAVVVFCCLGRLRDLSEDQRYQLRQGCREGRSSKVQIGFKELYENAALDLPNDDRGEAI